MWDVLLLFSSICTAVVVGAPDTVTGHRGERVEIRCSYKPGYESYSKYFCKGDCKYVLNKDIMVKSGSPAKDERFSLTDDTMNKVFTVTITDLRTEDQGQYWCAVKRALTTDVYSEILLLVKQSHISHSGSVIYVSVGLVIMVIIFFMTLMVWCRKISKKPSRVSQTGLSQQVSITHLPLNTTAGITSEDIDWNDHNYQEISEFQCKNKHTTTIYTKAETPDDPMIYSTAEEPDDQIIYSTADKPDDQIIYYTADKPHDPMIYSTPETPDDTMIYYTADKPDDLIIYSTADTPDDQ